MTGIEKENILKAFQATDLLIKDLNDLAKTSNPLLAKMAIELLQHASQIQQRLKQIETLDHQ